MRAPLGLVLAAGLAAALALPVVACDAPAADVDALSPSPDAPRNNDFRDASACSQGGGSGSGSGSGAGCGSGSGSGSVPVDATPCDLHTFTYQGEATSVWVSGSFTSWATMPPGARALTRDNLGTWTLTTQIGMGKQTYKLIIDGSRWIADPANPMSENDGYGGRNSVVYTCGNPG